LRFFGVSVLSYPSSLRFSLEFKFWPRSTTSTTPSEGGREFERGDVTWSGTAGGQFGSGGLSTGEWSRTVRFRFLGCIGLSWDGESGAEASTGGCGRGGVELITVLSGNGSEGGKSGLELGTGTVAGSELSCKLFPTGVARLIGRGFTLSFDFRAGVTASSSSVISMTSSAYGEDRFVALRARILARSAMSEEKLLKSGLMFWVVSLVAVGSE
jgi:hypothetical protein